MKKILLAILLVMLLIVPGVYAKSITYISGTNCGVPEAPCTCYAAGTSDRYFCEELETMYTVRKLHEGDVRYDTDNWDIGVEDDNLIFLGNISSNMIDPNNPDSTIFCNEINSKIIPMDDPSGFYRPVFSTGINNHVNAPAEEGCLFRLGIATFEPGSNVENVFPVDETKLFPITEHAITDDLPSSAELYTNDSTVRLIDMNGGLVKINCQPDPVIPFGPYPVVDIGVKDDKAIFWGLDNPEWYDDITWTLFRRTVALSMGDQPYGEVSGTLATDKNNYKPREYINITFTPDNGVTSAIVSYIKDPNGKEILENGVMQNTGTIWNFSSYKIADNAINGTYTISVWVNAIGGAKEFTKKINIIPYKIDVYTDSLSYSAGEDIEIHVDTKNAYSAGLNITANITLEDPNELGSGIHYGIIPRTFAKTYTSETDATGGVYIVKINLNDSDGREFSKELDFIIKTAGNITVSPKVWNKDITAPGEVSQVFVINNTGISDVENMDIDSIGDLDITFNKNSISKIEVGKSVNFTAEADIQDEGNYTGKIKLSTVNVEYIIDVKIDYEAEPIQDALTVSPSSWSVVTVEGKTVTKEFEVENTATVYATDIDCTISDDLDDIVTVESCPTVIDVDDTAKLELKVDTTDLDEDEYSGTAKIESSVGDDTVSINLEVIGDIYEMATSKLTEITELEDQISELEKAGKDVSSLNTLYDSIKSDLESAKSEFSDEDYAAAKDSYDSAIANIATLKSNIASLEAEQPDYSGIIWAVAIIIIIAIVGIVIWKYKDKIMDMISKQEKKPPEEEYYPPEPQEEYRTEYY